MTIMGSIDALYQKSIDISNVITKLISSSSSSSSSSRSWSSPSLSSSILLNKTNNNNNIITILSTSHRFITETNLNIITDYTTTSNESIIIAKIWSHILSCSNKCYNNWFSLLLTCKLITNGILSDIPIPVIVKCYNMMLSLSLNILNENNSHIRLSIDLSDYDNINCLIMSDLKTRCSLFTNLHNDSLQNIATCLLQSFLSSLNSTNTSQMLTPFIMYKSCVGYPVENILTFENALVMDIPLPLEFPDGDGISTATVALFDCNLENLLFYGEESIKIENDSSNDSLKLIEFTVLEQWADTFSNSNIKIVMSQRRIHPYLQRLLRDRGIISLPRLSMYFINAMQKLTGAKILGSLPSKMNEIIPSSCLGYIGNLRKKTMPGRTFILASAILNNDDEDENEQVSLALNDPAFISGVLTRRQRMSSIIITGPTKYVCDEIQDSFEIVMSNLTSMLGKSYVLPGGGCWQMYLAEKLQHIYFESNDKLKERNFISKAINVYIDTLKSCAQLFGNGTLNNQIQNSFTLPLMTSCDDSLYFASPADAYTKALKVNDEYKISSSNMLDPFESSQKSMELAVEIAITLLQIDGVVVAKPIELNKNI